MSSTHDVHRPVRVLLAKPGLDGHDRGVKVLAMALRDAGAEVLYLGLRQSAEQIANAAVQESIDVVGISVLSGVHLSVARDLVAALRTVGLDDVAVVVGGTVPPGDVPELLSMGVDAVFPVGSALDETVDAVMTVAAGSPRP
jgi:methylmalonyl-CoA mutase C-terminal domain/subunit